MGENMLLLIGFIGLLGLFMLFPPSAPVDDGVCLECNYTLPDNVMPLNESMAYVASQNFTVKNETG